MNTDTNTPRIARTDLRAGWPTTGRRALTVTAATAAALAVWTIAGPVAGVGLTARSGGGSPHEIGAAAVIAAALASGLAAWALLAVLERTARRAARIWTITASAVLVLSLSGPLTGDASAAATAVLAALHLVVGAVLIPGLLRTARR
ncbi:DUF6069 family protein [Actinomadura fibrosa]|uniref:DUF6069 family protein n=1 Tax=Actinomadura fibrosa TaxID=111802 RepID=A0ABW2XXW3_9ACTN|nr:DUF6069 family protein [Actinomadura fibrosa]